MDLTTTGEQQEISEVESVNTAADDGAQTTGATGGDKKKRIQFSPEQQEYVNALIDSRLAEDRRKREAEQQQAEQRAADEARRKALQDAGDWKTLYEQQQASLAKLQADMEQERLGRIRTEIAAKYNIPPSFAARLFGTTVDELEADAQLVAAMLKPPRAPSTEPGGTTLGSKGGAVERSRQELEASGRYTAL